MSKVFGEFSALAPESLYSCMITSVTVRLRDEDHDRSWTLRAAAATVGFQYQVYVAGYPEPVAAGWVAQEPEPDVLDVLLRGLMAVLKVSVLSDPKISGSIGNTSPQSDNITGRIKGIHNPQIILPLAECHQMMSGPRQEDEPIRMRPSDTPPPPPSQDTDQKSTDYMPSRINALSELSEAFPKCSPIAPGDIVSSRSNTRFEIKSVKKGLNNGEQVMAVRASPMEDETGLTYTSNVPLRIWEESNTKSDEDQLRASVANCLDEQYNRSRMA